MTLKRRIALSWSIGYSVLFGLLLIIIYYSFYDFRRDEFRQDLKDKSMVTAHFIAKTPDFLAGVPKFLSESDDGLYKEEILIFNSDKKLLYSTVKDSSISWDESFLRQLDGALGRHRAVVFTLVVDQLHLRDADVLVDRGAFLGRGRCFKRTANGNFSWIDAGKRRNRITPMGSQPPPHGEENISADGESARLEVGSGDSVREIAVLSRRGRAPGVFWLGGFGSNMRGAKATVESYLAGLTDERRKRLRDLAVEATESEDYKEGTRAFLEKRAAKFQGR